MFTNLRAGASIYVVSLSACSTLSVGATTQHFDGLSDLLRSDFQMYRTLALAGCANAFLAHCEAGLACSAEYAMSRGLELDCDEAFCDCRTGGCDSGPGSCD